MKKITTLLLALALTLALAAPVGAAESADAAAREATIMQLGGTVGGVNVLLGERCIAFTDASPEIVNGRTMVPLRAALEAMGATVDYDPMTRTASVTSERARFTHVIGSDTILLEDGTAVRMDTASYITPTNRTMVPVRFFSQVLGYDVFWDGGYRLVILLDRAAWIARVDANFTILNAQLARTARRVDTKRSTRETTTYTGTVTTDATGAQETFSASLSSLMGEGGMAMTLSADIGALTPVLAPTAEGETAALLRLLLSSLELEARYGDRLYLRSPLFDAFAPADAVAGETWYAMAESEVAALLAVQYGKNPTFGTYCYAAMTREDSGDFYAQLCAQTARVRLWNALAGDGALKRSGSSYRGHLDVGALTAQELAALDLTACEMDVTLHDNGRSELRVTMRVEKDGALPYTVDYSMTGSSTRTSARGTVSRNGCTVDFRADSGVSTTTDTVPAAPKEGAAVIDLG